MDRIEQGKGGEGLEAGWRAERVVTGSQTSVRGTPEAKGKPNLSYGKGPLGETLGSEEPEERGYVGPAHVSEWGVRRTLSLQGTQSWRSTAQIIHAPLYPVGRQPS